MLKRSAIVAVPFLAELLFTAAMGAEPPTDKGKAKPREVVFRPVTSGKPVEYRLPEKAAARLAELVGKAGREGTVSPDAPRLAPDGTFVLDGKAYHFYAEPGLLRLNPSGNKIEDWNDDTLKRLGKTVPSGGRWSQEAFDRWIAELEKPKETDGRKK
jgi:hypothetical protein